jgi:glycosyltransferase involved in cell wall biosynthesis
MKNSKNITIVIPAHNEEDSLPKLLPRLIKNGYEVILVDDGSTDRTYEIAKRFCNVVRNKKRYGKGYALRMGFKEVNTPLIVMMDADLSHEISDIQKLVNPLLKNKKIGLVIGSRGLGGSEEYTPSKTFGNIIITQVFNLFFSTHLTDSINGFKAMKKDITDNLRCNGFNIEVELLGNCIRKGYTIFEVPSYEIARRSGKSKLNKIVDGLSFLKQVFIEAYKTKF